MEYPYWSNFRIITVIFGGDQIVRSFTVDPNQTAPSGSGLDCVPKTDCPKTLNHYGLSYDVTVIQWITSCHKNVVTTRYIIFWCIHVTS